MRQAENRGSGYDLEVKSSWSKKVFFKLSQMVVHKQQDAWPHRCAAETGRVVEHSLGSVENIAVVCLLFVCHQ